MTVEAVFMGNGFKGTDVLGLFLFMAVAARPFLAFGVNRLMERCIVFMMTCTAVLFFFVVHGRDPVGKYMAIMKGIIHAKGLGCVHIWRVLSVAHTAFAGKGS